MFLVFNKQKIVTYFVSVLAVIVLFLVAENIKEEKVVETVSGDERLLPIYNVEIEEEKIAFTMNCAW